MKNDYYIDAFGVYRHKKKKPMRSQPKTDNNTAGQCHNNIHSGRMTLKMVRDHDCLGKKCPFFEKNDNHSHWKKKEAIKQKRKLEREMILV